MEILQKFMQANKLDCGGIQNHIEEKFFQKQGMPFVDDKTMHT
jgi:hypothetical protein